MIGSFDISKTLKMLHDAATYAFEENNHQKAIDILNDARLIEQKLGFRNQSAESMLEIATAYFHLNNHDLALWFVEEAMEILTITNKTSLLKKAEFLLTNIKESLVLEPVFS